APRAQSLVSADLAGACEAELAQSPDPLRAARLHYEIARASSDTVVALKHYQQAIALAPDHVAAIRGARRLLLEKKNVQAALPLYDAEIKLTGEPRAAALLCLDKGRVIDETGRDRDAVRKCYARAAELAPTDPAVLKALVQAQFAAEDWPGLERARALEANAVGNDPRHRAALLVERAHLTEVRLGDDKTATDLYQLALEVDPHASGALGALKRLLHAQGRWRELAQTLEREAAQSPDREVQAMAYFRMARVHAERLATEDEARAALVQAMTVAPADPLVLEELAKSYVACGDQQGLGTVLGRLVEITRGRTERLGLFMRLGEAARAQSDDEAAIRWYDAATVEDPSYAPARRALALLYTKHERWQPLVQSHLSEAEAVTDPLRCAQALAAAAEVLEQRLADPVEASEVHARALSLAPGHEASFKALVRLHASAGRFAALVELYRRAIDAAKDRDVAVAYWFKIGALCEDALHDPGQAIAAYRRILAVEPQHLGALHALERAAEAAGRPGELAEALELEAALAKEPARRVSLLLRAGEVLEQGLGDAEAALVRYRRVLEIDPKHAPVLGCLARVYQKLGRHRELCEVLDREIELATSPAARVALLHQSGELQELRLGDATQAATRYRRALAQEPRHGASRRALERLLRARADWRGVCELLEAELPLADEPEAKARTAYRWGEVLEVRLSELDKAAAAYQRALDAVPHYRPAADALARVLATLGAWSKLAEELANEAARAHDPRLSVEALLRAGELWHDRLKDPKRAIQSYAAVLERDPENVAALVALEALYRQAGAWEQLCHVYATEARVLVELPARIAALCELGRLMRAHGLGSEAEQRAIYDAVLSYDAQNPHALAALEELALAGGDAALLAQVDAAFARSARDPVLAAAHFLRLGAALEERSAAAAQASFRSALARDPESLGAMRGLARASERAGDAAGLCEALRREAAWTRDGRVAAELLCRSAVLRLEKLSDREGAVADAESALERFPDSPEAAARLCELCAGRAASERLVERLSTAASAARDPLRQAALWRDVARLQAEMLGNVPAAIVALERVRKLRPEDGAAARALAALYGRGAQWQQAAEVLDRVVALAPPTDELVEVHLELARIAAQHTGEPGRALASLQALLKHAPTHRAALVMMMDLEHQAGRVEAALAVAERLAQTAQDAVERAWALVQVGQLALGAGDKKRAAEALRAAVVIEGPVGPSGEQYRKLCADGEGWPSYLEVLREHLRRYEAREVADADITATYLELARTQHGALGRPEEAFATLRAGLAACGEAPVLRLELADRLVRVGRGAEGIAELQRLLALDPTVASGWRALARTYHEQGRPSEASLAAAPLCVLGTASEPERALAQQLPQRVRPAMVRPGSFSAAQLGFLTAANPTDENRIGLVFAALAEGFAKAYAFEPDSYGVSSRDRLGERSDHPVRALCDRLAGAFAVERYDLYLSKSPGGDVRVELGQPPALFVPSYLLDRSEAQQAFALGRVFAAIARNMHPALRLSRGEIACVVTGAVRLTLPDFLAGQYDDEHSRTLQRRVLKPLSRRAKKALEEVSLAYEKPAVDLEAALAASELTNTRAAALAAGDLFAAVELLRQLGPSPVGIDGVRLVKSLPVAADLLRFWVSDAALEFRRRAGML
ncbi:MAG: tetratricopeptide repeat protein, partial [Myxococcales bacterium]|nr:tetratricopeptide repeat protein [Myxococcales bacterium]